MPPFARHRIETLIKEELWSQVGSNQLGYDAKRLKFYEFDCWFPIFVLINVLLVWNEIMDIALQVSVLVWLGYHDAKTIVLACTFL